MKTRSMGLAERPVCQTVAAPRDWEVREVEVRHVDGPGADLAVLAEVGEARRLSVRDVPGEAFAFEFQQVDVTREGEVAAFCDRWGLVTSPFLESKQRLAAFRARHVLGGWEPLGKDGDLRDGLARLVAERTPQVGERDLCEVVALSEAARVAVAGDARVAGAISLAEAALTIRLLQVACVLPVVVTYACDHDWDVDDVVGYLADARFMAQGGDAVMLGSPADLFCGHRLDTYGRMVASYDDFAAGILRSGVEDPQRHFDVALARSLGDNAQTALDVLSASASAWARVPSLVPTSGGLAAVAGALSAERVLGSREILAQGGVCEAIVWQLLTGMANETPLRRCRNCGRIFKRYREERPKRSGHIRETAYCRKSCAVVMSQRRSGEGTRRP